MAVYRPGSAWPGSHFGCLDTEVYGMKPRLHGGLVLCEGVPAELDAHYEQPQRKGEAHGADGDARGEAGSEECAEDATDDEIDEECGVEAGAVEMERAAYERETEAEGEVGADDPARVERSEAEECEGAECTGT
jgi:hypothetical protein